MSYDLGVPIRRAFRGVPKAVDTVGEQALFYGETMRYIPNALTRYRKETIRLIAEMTMGTGALVMIGGTVGVAAFLTLASGGVIAVQGYSSLRNNRVDAAATISVPERIVAPVIAGIALAATIGGLPACWVPCELPRRSTPSKRWLCVRCLSGVHPADRGPDRDHPLYSLSVLATFFTWHDSPRCSSTISPRDSTTTTSIPLPPTCCGVPPPS
jgi:phospholipid/cholesterol/gamma-HCH transport system permease protein